MKKVVFMMAFITMFLAGCSNNAKKQNVTNVDSVAVADSAAKEADKVITEIDTTSKLVDELVNQL